MELERREHDTFTMSRLSNVNFSSLLTTSKFARLKVFLLHVYDMKDTYEPSPNGLCSVKSMHNIVDLQGYGSCLQRNVSELK